MKFFKTFSEKCADVWLTIPETKPNVYVTHEEIFEDKLRFKYFKVPYSAVEDFLGTVTSLEQLVRSDNFFLGTMHFYFKNEKDALLCRLL